MKILLEKEKILKQTNDESIELRASLCAQPIKLVPVPVTHAVSQFLYKCLDDKPLDLQTKKGFGKRYFEEMPDVFDNSYANNNKHNSNSGIIQKKFDSERKTLSLVIPTDEQNKDYVTSTSSPTTNDALVDKLNKHYGIGDKSDSVNNNIKDNLEIILEAIDRMEKEKTLNKEHKEREFSDSYARNLSERLGFDTNKETLDKKYLEKLLSNELRVKKIELLHNIGLAKAINRPSTHSDHQL